MKNAEAVPDDLAAAVGRDRFVDRIAMFLLVLAAVVVINWRWPWMKNDPLWLDELHSWWAISDSWGAVAPRAAAGNQTPVYFMLAWMMKQLVLVPQYSVRLISAFAGGALLVVTGQFVWHRTRSIPAVLASVAGVAFSANQLFYATEGRPYELLGLVGCFHLFAFLPLLDFGTKAKSGLWNSLLLVGLGTLGVQIHPCFAVLLAAECGALMFVSASWALRKHPPSPARISASWMSLGVAMVLPAISLVAMFPWIGHTATNRSLWESVVSPDLTFTSALREAFATSVLLAAVFFARRVVRKRGNGLTPVNARGKDPLATSGILLFVFLMTGFGLCLATWLQIAPLALPRYQMAAVAAPFLATGLAIGAIPQVFWQRVASAAMIAVLFAVPMPDRIFGASGLSTISGFGWNGRGLVLGKSNLRNEPWEQMWGNVEGFDGVILLANILEDKLREPGVPGFHFKKPSRAGISLDDYLRFPAALLNDPGTEERVIPCRTLERPRITALEFQALVRSATPPEGYWKGEVAPSTNWKVWLVVRGRPETAEDAKQEILGLLDLLKKEIGSVQYQEQWMGDLYVVRFTLVDLKF